MKLTAHQCRTLCDSMLWDAVHGRVSGNIFWKIVDEIWNRTEVSAMVDTHYSLEEIEQEYNDTSQG